MGSIVDGEFPPFVQSVESKQISEQERRGPQEQSPALPGLTRGGAASGRRGASRGRPCVGHPGAPGRHETCPYETCHRRALAGWYGTIGALRELPPDHEFLPFVQSAGRKKGSKEANCGRFTG